MKKLFLTILLILASTTLVHAKAHPSPCPSGYKATVPPDGFKGHFTPQCYQDIDTDTDTDTDTLGTPQDQAGVGANVVLWQNEKENPLVEEVTAEYRRDLDNDTNSIYGVVRLNLWEKIKDKFKKKEVVEETK